MESEEPIEERIYDLPSRLNRAIPACDYKVHMTLQQRRGRHAMETGAEHGHTGEEAWTIVAMDGGVHEQWCSYTGLLVGHMGYNSHKRSKTQKSVRTMPTMIKTPRPCCRSS